MFVLAVLATITLIRSAAPPPGAESAALTPIPGGVASTLAPGDLAMPVRTSSNAAVAGLVRRGDHVDVLAFFPASPTNPSASRLLLADRVVLAAAQDGTDLVLTLEVTADEATTLQQAALLQARPYVSLRSAAGEPNAASTDWFTDASLVQRLSGTQ